MKTATLKKNSLFFWLFLKCITRLFLPSCFFFLFSCFFFSRQTIRRVREDSNPRYLCKHAGFQDRFLQPLRHSPLRCFISVDLLFVENNGKIFVTRFFFLFVVCRLYLVSLDFCGFLWFFFFFFFF